MGMFSDAVVEGATLASPSGGGAEEDMTGWLLDVERWREQELSLYEKTMIHLSVSVVYRDQQEAKDTEFSCQPVLCRTSPSGSNPQLALG